MENPRNQEVLKALVLHSPDTINVIALSRDLKWILVEQFRFGIDRCLIELPAGLMDGDESPLEAAKRELLEETGYVATNWTLLGESFLNPAYVTNRCYHFLAVDATYHRDISPDATEDLRVHLEPVTDLLGICQSDLLIDAVGNAAVSFLRKYLN
ncbi:MAG: NUDIX hydrolase [Saprospiraceae bacterium]|nr:NUDIX hydrolase [Saprospiraceae bacterium]